MKYTVTVYGVNHITRIECNSMRDARMYSRAYYKRMVNIYKGDKIIAYKNSNSIIIHRMK